MVATLLVPFEKDTCIRQVVLDKWFPLGTAAAGQSAGGPPS